MKKIRLLIFILFMFMLIPSVYAENTVEEVDNILITPPLSGKKYVYINNMENYEITINDTSNFKVIERERSYIVIYNVPTSSKTYNNPYEVYWDKIGYYVNDEGKPVYLDAKLKVNKIMLKWANGISDSNYSYYNVAQVEKLGFIFYAKGYTSNFEEYFADIGNHEIFTITLYNDDGTELSNDLANSLYLQWDMYDLDVGDRTITKNQWIYDVDGTTPEFVESIKFNSGFDSKFYILKDSVLKISDNNTKYSATEFTGNDSGYTDQKPWDYSSVIAYQTSATAEAEWWGNECGTAIVAISNQLPYPTYNNPTKAVDNKVYKTGDKVDYTIKELFPYTDSHSKAKSIELIDTFDKALDISKLTYQVFDSNNKDVTKEWEKSIEGQTVTLKYIGEDTSAVYGEFTFKFNDLKVLSPNSSHETIKEKNITYKIIPNKATIKIVGANDNTTTKDTNIVNIKVRENNPQTGIKVDLIIKLLIIISISTISIYYLMNNKKLELK